MRADTGLRVVPLCGQNKTVKVIKSLHDDSWDVLVATAGLVDSLIKNNQIFLASFSCVVFDEAHHALKAHMYSHVLTEVLKMPVDEKPRVLGLTASPFRVKSITKVQRIYFFSP